jgi:uncharacterized membrane protein HdeD (DUF308 family)
MLRVLAEGWWFLTLRGIFALAFALISFSLRTLAGVPFLTPVTFTAIEAFFVTFAMVSGLITVAAALRGWGEDKWWLLLLEGVAAAAVGGAVLLKPTLTFADLLRWMAVWAVIVGILEVIAALHLRRHIPDEWLLACSGVGSLLFGIVLLARTPNTPSGLLYWLSSFALFSAAVMISLSLRLRAWWRHASDAGAGAGSA